MVGQGCHSEFGGVSVTICLGGGHWIELKALIVYNSSSVGGGVADLTISKQETKNMPCRVGITTDPVARKLHWERKVVGLINWKQSRVGSKTRAQEEENKRKSNCNRAGKRGTFHGHPGGGDPDNGNWYVYEFDYVRER